MKTEQEYLKDLSQIRSMMERSVKFLSLTGWSGIMAGIYALIGAFVAWLMFYNNQPVISESTSGQQPIPAEAISAALLALAVLVLTIGTAIFFSYRKAKKKKEKLWNRAARRLLVNLSIPLVTGGLLIIILFLRGEFILIPALSLIFYGLALINASSFTYEQVKYLGMAEIVMGLGAALFTGYGLFFWAAGFGIIHIIYGIYMHFSLEK